MEKLIQETKKWQENLETPRMPSQGKTAGKKAQPTEVALAYSWIKMNKELKAGAVSEENKAKLRDVPGAASTYPSLSPAPFQNLSKIALLVREVRQWQEEAHTKSYPKRDRPGVEGLLAYRCKKIATDYEEGEFTTEDKALLDALPGWSALLAMRKAEVVPSLVEDVREWHEAVSYTHLTLPTKRIV